VSLLHANVGMFYAMVILMFVDPTPLIPTSPLTSFGVALFVDLLIVLIAGTVVLVQKHQSKGKRDRRRAKKT
jgi:hypothetical protein